ncbi:MAG: DNA recombination protein RmuC [Candidatus Zixiibacteriota bacterium]|nr:MAG: DNA recombination protein RmuC [candidate division Zixibacteria bacterium]
MQLILIFIAGAIFGALVVYLVYRRARAMSSAEIIQLSAEMEDRSKSALFDLTKQSIEQLSDISRQILDAKTSETSAQFEEKKKLIDQSLTNMSKDLKERLGVVQTLMTEINKLVPEKYGQVSTALENIARQSDRLRETTQMLSDALSGSQERGIWGERMAEDILRIVGLKENINYVKQKAVEGGRSRPDFTFFLPNELKVNMDVKFPYNQYKTFIESENEIEKEKAKKQFLNSVRGRIKEVTGRDYINPDDNTVDYVLVFIPVEQVYTFIHEQDSAIIDEALKQKVILCSPLTLYAMLALIRQAIDNFNLQQSSRKIQALLGGFAKQWKMFVEAMGEVGKKIDSARKSYDDLVGKRTRMLDRQVSAIDRENKADGIKSLIANDDSPPELEDKTGEDEDLLL